MKRCLKCGGQFSGAGWACPACGFSPKNVGDIPSFAPAAASSRESYDPHFYERLAGIEEGNFWFRSRNRLILYALQRYFPTAEKFLEVGCGTGFVLSAVKKALPGMSLCGSDLYPDGLRFAAARCPGVELFQMDACDMPFVDEFDVIGAFDVLEHIEQDSAVLAQMFRALRKGGGIIAAVPQHAFLWSGTDEYARHVRRYSAAELRQKAEAAGFRVIRTFSFVSLLLPLMFISRLGKRKNNGEIDIISELTLGRPMEAVLEKILDIERCIIRANINMPFGGSLFLIAKKI